MTKYPTNCDICGCEIKDKFANQNHKKRSNCVKEMKRGRPPKRDSTSVSFEDDDNNSTTSTASAAPPPAPARKKTFIIEPDDHFKATLPTLVNMVIENDNDASCLRLPLKADTIFREDWKEVEELAKYKGKEATEQINFHMSQVNNCLTSEGLSALATSYYAKDSTDDGSFAWKVSNDELTEEMEKCRKTIIIIENVLKVRSLMPYKIACEYIEKNIEKIMRKPNNNSSVIAPPASASQLF
jgi:hypothetical protein